MNILFLTDEIRATSGVTTHIHNLLEALSRRQGNHYYLICGSLTDKDKFTDLNVQVIENPDFKHENRSLRHFFKALIFLRQFCRKNKIDIIHSHTHYAANIAYHTSYTVNVATIQTNHGILHDSGRLDHFKARQYVAINDHIYEYILSNKIATRSNISLIRCGIPVPENLPDKNQAGKLKFLAASRFVRDKGIDLYIQAVGLLPEDYRAK